MEKAKKKIAWSAASEELLCEMWREKVTELRGNRKNGHIYKEIAESLTTYDVFVSSEEVRTKINNLTGRYRKEKNKIGPSGGTRSDWFLYDTVHSILGSFKSFNLDSMMDESDRKDDSSSGPTPSSSTTATSDTGSGSAKKRKTNIDIVKEIQEARLLLGTMQEEEKETDSKMLSIEERRNELLEEFVSASKSFQKSLLEVLNKK